MTMFARTDARVLVVDDDSAIVRLLTRGLASAGYSQVTGMSESTEVLGYVEENAPDLIVLDLTMPGMDGFELLAELNSRLPVDTFLPVLVLSGLHDQESKERAFRAGAKDYLTKPVELKEFLLHIDSLLETRFMSVRLHEAQSAMEKLIGHQAEELYRSDLARRHVAKELSETELKFRTVADFTHDWEYWMDDEQKFVWISPSVGRITGYSVADFMADPALIENIVHPDDRAMVAAHLRASAERGAEPGSLDFRIVTRSGEIRWVSHFSIEVVDSDGRRLGRRASNRDITDRKTAEELLRLTQFSVDNAADSVFWLDSEGNVLFVSESTGRALGYSMDELLKLSIYDVDPSLHTGRYSRNWERIQKESTVRFETTHRKKDGTTFPVEVTLNYVVFEGREFNCVFARNISERLHVAHQLEESLTRLRESQATIIQVLSSVTELRDPYTAGHQQRVAQICVAIASHMGLAPERVEGLEVAALLHDVGKVSVPLEVLSIPGKFSLLQRMLVEGHVAAGYEILRPIYLPWPVAEITLQHHERLDGSGYPARLKGEQIMLEARILSVADTFEAMTTHRPYRGALEVSVAIKELEAGRGTVFDPTVVDACVTLVKEGKITPRMEPDLRTLSFMT
jgi:PAS domain S-box-containing protein/putative nucleotidyltransferase with HDIG domain